MEYIVLLRVYCRSVDHRVDSVLASLLQEITGSKNYALNEMIFYTDDNEFKKVIPENLVAVR